jgi:porphobilinogen deaminase
MAGQSSQLSLKEAKAMQERIQASGSHAKTHGSSKTSSGDSVHKKEKTKKEEC